MKRWEWNYNIYFLYEELNYIEMDCEKYILYVDVSLLLSDFFHFTL